LHFMTKDKVILQNERLRRRYEKAFRPLLLEVMRDHYNLYISSLKENGVQHVLNDNTAFIIDVRLTALIRQMYVTCGIGRATLTYRALQRLPRVERKRGTIGFNAQWTDDILNYFRLNLYNKVVLPIAETTQEWIRKVLNEGIEKGWTIDQMVEEIIRKDYLDGRVERILRTEINRAINYGNQLAAKAYEFRTKKRWIAVHDSRTRHHHLEADGQTVEIDEPFNIGGEPMDFPGDPDASAENVINCRCVTEIVPVRSRQGRLTPKEPRPVRISSRLRRDLQDIIADLDR